MYFFTVIAISLASLFMGVGQRLRRPNYVAAKRYTTALIGVVAAWIALLAGALFALLSDQDAVTILPPLERLASFSTIILLSWAFLTADYSRWGNNSVILLVGLLGVTFLAYILTAIQWADVAGEIDFNLSVLGATWTFAATAVSTLGIILVLSSYSVVVDAPLKLVFYLILLLGYGGTLFQIVQGNIIGDYAGPIRLAFVSALTITPVVVYRAIVGHLEAEIKEVRNQAEKVAGSAREPTPIAVSRASETDRESVHLLKALGLILEDATANSVPDRILHAVTDVLKIDVVGILRMQDANYADVSKARDNVMGRSIQGVAINLDNQPTLANAIERRQQRALYVDRNDDEIQDVYYRLDVDQVGPVYFQPLVRDNELIAVLMLAQPYANRELSQAEAEMLKGIGVIAGSLLALSDAAHEAEMLAEERTIQAMVQGVAPVQFSAARQDAQTQLQLAREQIAELSKQVVQLKIELDDERNRVAAEMGDTAEGESISQQLLALTKQQQDLRNERDSLSKRLQEAEAALQSATIADDDVRIKELIETLEREKIDLIAERDRLQLELDNLREFDGMVVPDEMQSVIDRMTQERSRLEQERDQFEVRLGDMQSQLEAVGIVGGAVGLADFINQITEQRSLLQSQNTQLTAELNNLIQDRDHHANRIAHEDERDARLQTLEQELNNLAGDREIAIKQRDQFKTELDDLMEKIEVVKQHRARLLAQNAGYDLELKEVHATEAGLREKIQELSNQKSDLAKERDRFLAEREAAVTERDLLMARAEGDRIEELSMNSVGMLTVMINELTDERNTLEKTLAEAQRRLGDVEDKLEALQVREEGNLQPRNRPENPELLIGLVEELRTPMTSITGYVDLLLGESAGILGEMQRKFLQRVSTNVTRLYSMLEDLVHVTELDTGRFKLEPVSVNVVNLIEDAITNASNQFREKGLALNLDITDDLPLVRGDPDAIGQIVGQLLTNAYLASPPGTEITITARKRSMPTDGRAATHVLFVSVADRGGGISPEDTPRVFARKYKAENPLIHGLGDTGVGLSVAKTLVESHGGDLWLETEENVGSVFNFVLPLANTESTHYAS